MRVFLAIEFPENIKQYLNQVQLTVREQSIKGNFTKKENYHLTLHFIGEIRNDEREKLKEAIDEAAGKQNCFEMILNQLGHFARGNKQIIWVGIQPNKMLDNLYSQLGRSLKQKGYTIEERKFVPHITIGREVVVAEEFNKIKQRMKMDKVVIPVSRISLMESTRIKGELKYISLYTKEFS